MGDEYQNRRDIDKIYDDLYDQINGSLNVLKFDKDSEFKNISSKEDGSDVGTIDAIINYYQLTEKGGGSGDLSDYYTKTEINTILSSYVTNETLDDYALKSELFSGSYNDLDDVPSTFPPSSHSHNWDSVTGKPSTFPPSTHNHDDIYYTETEIDTILSSYATSSEVTSRLAEYVKLSYATATFSPKSHNHDDRYYTESEIDSQMYDKSDRWHTHSTDDISDENVSDYTEIYKHTLPSTPTKLSHDLYAIDTELGYKVDTNDSRLSDARTPTAHTHDDRYYTESEVDTALNGKQDNLVSGTNIRTVNGNDLLGSGDIVIGGTGAIDDTVTQNSSNPVKSSGIYSALSNKANSTHSHSISDVTNLQSSLNDKVDEDTLLDLIYPIGSIYISANSSHSVCPIQTLLGGTWERIQDKFLLSSASQQGVGTTGGSADSVVVSHTHTQASHTHTTGNSTYKYFYAGKIGIGTTANKKAHTNNTSGIYLVYSNDEGGDTIKEYTTIQSQQPTINAPSDGVSGVGANMPPYLVVNVWKRVPDP